MPRFASKTTVSMEKSRAEIESTLVRYKASEFTTGWKTDAAFIAFKIKSLFVRFILPIPPRNERRFTHKEAKYGIKKRSEIEAEKAWDQEVRQRWRALLLVIKAKLEAVECQITSLEQEFLAHIVMPNDITIGDWMITNALPQIRAGNMPLMLPAPKEEDIIDVEVSQSKAKE